MSIGLISKQSLGIKPFNTQQIMLLVVAALIPGTITYAVLISYAVLINVLFAVLLSVLLEALALKLRSKSVATGIGDGSIVLAAWLLALAVPPLLPLWQLSLGLLVMVMLGKQIYGGLGSNPFNPAMVGYAVLLVSFPQTMTWWFAEGALNQINVTTLVHAKLQANAADLDLSALHAIETTTSLAVTSSTAANTTSSWDLITKATPLEHVRSLKLQGIAPDATALNEWSAYAAWAWVNLAFLLGGFFLLYKRIIQWHIPASLLLSFTVLQLLFADNSSPPIYYAWLSGALILGAFFIATDPVTAASSKRGRLIYGAGIGVFTFIIREYGGYPEGIAFAVLLMNMCVPLIDHFELHKANSQ
jgi:electron transport complex protein RnfD